MDRHRMSVGSGFEVNTTTYIQELGHRCKTNTRAVEEIPQLEWKFY